MLYYISLLQNLLKKFIVLIFLFFLFRVLVWLKTKWFF